MGVDSIYIQHLAQLCTCNALSCVSTMDLRERPSILYRLSPSMLLSFHVFTKCYMVLLASRR